MENELSAWNQEVRGCSDLELMARVERLTAADKRLVARLVVYLGEVETRGLYRERAYGSMFEFLIEELRMSLFAQPLGAAIPVSEQRILAALMRLR